MTIVKTLLLHSYSDNSIHFHPNPVQEEVLQSPVAIPKPNQVSFDFTNVSPSSSQSTDDGGAALPTPITTSNGGQNSTKKSRSRRYCKNFRKGTRGIYNLIFNRKNWAKTFPIVTWLPQYNTRKMVSDIIAGVTVGLTILPQGLAYATIAGLPPIYGLYSGFVGPLVYIIFGSTKVVTVGPNAIQCILIYKFTQAKPPEYAVYFCFMTGVVNSIMAILRLGFITHFISFPVISAFTSAVALTIVATQVKALVGIHFEDEGFLPTLIGLSENITEVHKWDSILSLICCLSILFLVKLQAICNCVTKEFPKLRNFIWLLSTSRNAIVISTCTVVAAFLKTDPSPFSLVGELEPGLPSFKLPPFEIFNNATNTTHTFFNLLREEAPPIFIMALLGLMGHITIAKAFTGSARVHATQEALALGITNLLSSFVSSMPVAGSFSRTTVNAFSGAESPMGGFITGIMVICALQFLTPYFYFIPKASLASVVITSVVYMVDFSILRPLWRSKKTDLLPWSLTFLTTLFVGVEYGILTGLVMSAIFLLYHAARPRVRVVKGETTMGTEFILVELDRSLTYPSVDYVTDIILESTNICGGVTAPIVIDCHHIQFLDFTAGKSLCDLVQDALKLNHKTIFWKVKPSMLKVMQGIMHNSHTPFIHCKTDSEMEEHVDSAKNGVRQDEE